MKASSAIGASRLVTGLTSLGGAARGATPAVAAVGAAGATAAGGMTTASGASTKAAGTMAALGRAGGALARNLPLIGIALVGVGAAVDEFSTSTSEAVAGLQATGQAGIAFRAELREQDAGIQANRENLGEWSNTLMESVNSFFGITYGTKAATDAFNEQLATMTPLQRSYALTQQAQGALDDAIARFGPGSRQAVDAFNALNVASENNAVQMELAGLAGQAYYQKLSQLVSVAGPAGDAARRFASGLSMAELSAIGASVSINQTGQAIATLPDGKTIVLRANGNDAAVQIQAVSTSLDKVPPGKTVNVGVIGAAAIEMLRSIGVQVTTLPDGTVEVTANTQPVKDKLAQTANDIAAGAPLTVPLTVDTMLADNKVNDFRGSKEGGPPIFMPTTANTAPANAAVDLWAGYANALNPNPAVSANTAQATWNVNSWDTDAARRNPIPTVNANTAPATGASNQWDRATQGLLPIPGVSANTGQADARSRDWERTTAGMRPTPQVDANTGPARSVIQGLKDWASRAVSFVVNAVTGKSAGDITQPMAEGGVVANAPGNYLSPYNRKYGDKELRQMPGGGARMVAPNTWRVVGDRMDVPELYAPLDGSGRSLSLIAQGAAAFGKAVVDAKAIAQLTGTNYQMPRSAPVPQRVNVAGEMAMAGGNTTYHTVNIDAPIHNPVAERGSDSVARHLSRLSDLGLFGSDV